MSEGGFEDKRRVFGWLRTALCAGALMLGFSAGAFAQHKCLYYEGSLWEWDVVQGSPIWCTDYAWDGANLNQGFSDAWGPPGQVLGSAGACVFQGKIYCFGVTADDGGTLWWVAYDPDSDDRVGTHEDRHGPRLEHDAERRGGRGRARHDLRARTPARRVSRRKTGRASRRGTTPSARTLPSRFSTPCPCCPRATIPPASCSSTTTREAPSAPVFSRPRQRPRRTTFFFRGRPQIRMNGSRSHRATSFWGRAAGTTVSRPAPRPRASSSTRATGQGQDGYHQGRWEYNVAAETWAFNDITVSGAAAIEAWPWYETVDQTTFTMRQSHVVSYWVGRSQTNFVNPSDWMIPQNNDPSYGWQGTPTPTAGATTSDLQSLWTLVGVVLGPPPFAMNGASNACPSGVGFSWVDYGKDTSTTVTTTSTSSSTVSVAMNNSVKAGFGEFSLDLSYAHAWTSSHSNYEHREHLAGLPVRPVHRGCGKPGHSRLGHLQRPHARDAVVQAVRLRQQKPTSTRTSTRRRSATSSSSSAYFELADPSQGDYPGLFAGMPAYPNSTDVTGWRRLRLGRRRLRLDASTFGDKTDPQMPVAERGRAGRGVLHADQHARSAPTATATASACKPGAACSFAGFSQGVTVGYDGEWTTNTENESTITQSVTCALNMPAPPSPCPPATCAT